MEEKPFAPSTKKLQRVRQQGGAPQSRLLTCSVSTTLTLLALGLLSPVIQKNLGQILQQGLQGEDLDLWPILGWWMFLLCLPWISSYLITGLQTGWLITWQNLKPKWKKREPKALGEILLAGVLGTLLFGILCGWVMCSRSGIIEWEKVYTLAVGSSVGCLVLGIVDWKYRQWRFYQQNRMSVREKQEEQRESEGSPLKRQRRQTLQERR